MNVKLSVIIFLISLYIHLITGIKWLNERKCSKHIYRKCTHQTSFTSKEIIIAQLYLQKRFSVTKPSRPKCMIDPNKPPCIRKDIKCLTNREIRKLTNAWIMLYRNGVIAKFTKLHYDYWGAEHKFMEGVNAHLWLINQLEKQLQKIDPTICMPYWNSPQDFAYPEKSKIWKIFGHSGTAKNDYCVTDGPFAKLNCSFPYNQCLKRQWRNKTSLYPWKSPEYYTMASQMFTDQELADTLTKFVDSHSSPQMLETTNNALKYIDIIGNENLTSYPQLIWLQTLNAHFDTHLSIGGWNGDMSVPNAPNDPVFYLFHIAFELYQLLWQLSDFDDYYLVPKSFNAGMKYDNITKTRRFANIDSDTFGYSKRAYVKDSFQFGYGDMCHLYDIMIKPINDIVNKNLQFELRYPNFHISNCVPDVEFVHISKHIEPTLPHRLLRPCNPGPLPTAAQRLKNALRPNLFNKYFPKFACNKWTQFDHIFYEISDRCNHVSNNCRKMPLSLPFNATEEGRRQYQSFTKIVADIDLTEPVNVGEKFYEKFMSNLEYYGYCSPYV